MNEKIAEQMILFVVGVIIFNSMQLVRNIQFENRIKKLEQIVANK